MLRFLKTYALPVAMAVGCSLYLLFAYTPALVPAGEVMEPIIGTFFPCCIFLILFFTFVRLDYHQLRLTRWHLVMLLCAVGVTGALTGALLLFTPAHSDSRLIIEAIITITIAPCASAAPVITTKLGGSLAHSTTYTLLSALTATVCIPAIFPILEGNHDVAFWTAFLYVLQRTASVLLLPLVAGYLMQHLCPPFCRWICTHPNLSFYSWCVALSIVSGVTLRNILHAGASAHLLTIIALLSLVTSIVLFGIGRGIGYHYGEPICCGQAMFQKNAAMAIWVAVTYLNPAASIGAGCYILWQNIINSIELALNKNDR